MFSKCPVSTHSLITDKLRQKLCNMGLKVINFVDISFKGLSINNVELYEASLPLPLIFTCFATFLIWGVTLTPIPFFPSDRDIVHRHLLSDSILN